VGATVAQLSEVEVHEVFAIMEGLESVGVREAAARLNDREADELAGIVADMDVAVEERQYEHWAELNGRYHRAIGNVAAMPLLREMTDRVLSRWERLRRHYFQGVLVPRVEQAQREHRELLAALVARDPDGAERVVRLHNRNAQAAYSLFLQQHSAPEARP
jgi:DNA-binding GntR family transcriptional regulator